MAREPNIPPGVAGSEWPISFGLSLGAVVAAGYARFAYGLILPAMRADLQWTYAEAGWINTANALGYFLGSVLTLAAIRRVGSRPLYVGGVLVTTLSLIMTGVGGELWTLSFWRLMAGVGGAPVFIAGGALAAGLFLNDRHANAASIALFFGGGGLGVLISGLFLPPLFDRYGAAAWREAWGVLGALSLISALVSIWAIRRLRVETKVAGVPASVASAPLPIARMSASLVGYGLFALGYIIYFTFLVAWMRTRAIPTAGVMWTWSALGVGAMLGPLAWRRVLASSDTGFPLALACAATALATSMLLVWTSPAAFEISALLFGLSFFNAPTAVTNFSRKNLDQKYWGSAVALYTTIFAVGQTLGPVGAGWLTDATGNLIYGFAAAAIILVAGALAASLQPALPR